MAPFLSVQELANSSIDVITVYRQSAQSKYLRLLIRLQCSTFVGGKMLYITLQYCWCSTLHYSTGGGKMLYSTVGGKMLYIILHYSTVGKIQH